MNLFRTLCVASLSLAASAPLFAQGVPYDRGVSSLAYVPAHSGAGAVLTGQLAFAAMAPQDHDLSMAMSVFVNGAQVGPPVVADVLARPGCPSDFCDRCRGICLNFGIVCICINLRSEGNIDGQARFAIPMPSLKPGDVAMVQLHQVPGSLPEIDTSDDTAVLVIAPPPCRADFTGDGVVNSQDFFAFLTAFFQGVSSADFNHDGGVNSQDFFDFLSAFFMGC
jgi:hypothetical protein